MSYYAIQVERISQNSIQARSSLIFKLIFKLLSFNTVDLQLYGCTHYDAADRLHLIFCNSQKSTELLRTLLHAKNLQKHTVEPSLASEKVDTISSHPATNAKISTKHCPGAHQNMLKNTP